VLALKKQPVLFYTIHKNFSKQTINSTTHKFFRERQKLL